MKSQDHIAAFFSGRTQKDRALPGLTPTTFGVDERGTADLLAFTVKFAKALSYFNPRNERDGNWQQLLLTEPAILTAYVAKTDPFMEFSRFLDYRDGIIAKSKYTTRKLFTQQFFSIGFHIVLRINRWYKLSKPSHSPFHDYLHRTIKKKGKAILQEYYQLYFVLCESIADFENESLAKLEDLDRLWLFEPFPRVKISKVKEGDDESASLLIIEQVEKTVLLGQTLFHLQEKIIADSSTFFETAIQQSDISPHVGLLLTFFDLFKYQQDDLNQLTENHLNFYFRSILGFKNQAPVADTTFVTFQLAKGKDNFEIVEETALSAGSNAEGQKISFVTQKPLTLTAGLIKAYQTLNFKRSDDQKTLLGLYRGTYKSFDTLSAPSWPVFGSTTASTNYTVEDKQTLGFAISCPDLILNSGERKITVRFSNVEFSKSAPSDAKTIEWSVLPSGTTTEEASSSSKTEEDSIPLFDIQLTTAKGWLLIKDQPVTLASDKNGIKMTIDLQTSDAAIVPYQEKIHGSGFETSWPVCKATLRNEVTVTIFEELNNFSFNQFLIETEVTTTEDLVVQTDRGKVSSKIPFQPFGNAPLPGASLYIGGQELFVKSLQQLDFTIEWDHLPDDFSTYYKGYSEIYENQSFQASLNFLGSGGKWVPLDETQGGIQFPLFTETLSSETNELSTLYPLSVPLRNPRELNFTIDGLIAPQPDLPVITAFSQKNSNAFFKLSFAAPDQGFGTDEYPKMLSRVTLKNGQAIIRNSKICKESNSKCSSAIFCEAVYATKDTIDLYEEEYKKELGKTGQVKQLLKDCTTDICRILSSCKSTENCDAAIDTQLDLWEAKLKSSLKNSEENIRQILENTFNTFDDFLKEYRKIIPSSSSSSNTGSKKKQNPKDFLKNLMAGATEAWAKPLGGVLSAIGKKLFGNVEKKLGKSIDIWVHSKTQPKTCLQKIKEWLQKIFSAEGPGSIKSDEEEFDELMAYYSDLIQQILSQFKSAVTALREGRKKPPETVCRKFETSLWGVKELLTQYQSTAIAWAVLFQTLDQLFEGWITKGCADYTPLKPLPNKPFIPKIKSLSASYQSSLAGEISSDNTAAFQFYHLTPFGIQERSVTDSDVKLFPFYDAVPYAFLGLQNLKAGEILTILFVITSQLKSLSAKTQRKIDFEYLSDTGWIGLDLESDGTYGFEQTGIVQFLIPDEMSDQSPLMPTGMYWLRISNQLANDNTVEDSGNPVNVTTNFIAPQAVSVVRNLSGQTDFQAIAPGTIKSPVLPTPEIKKILQPIISVGGQSAENTDELYQRTAYRLNHKNRIVHPADLENLVLQNFQFLYQATAAPMSYYGDKKSKVVSVALVPYTDYQSEHPYRPLVAPYTLRDVLTFLEPRALPSMEIELVNPDFRELTVTAEVQFTRSNAGGLLCKQLNDDLINYLSPWVKDNPIGETINGEYNLANLRAFILSRSYIISISYLYFQLEEIPTSTNTIESCTPPNVEEALQPWELIVSNLQHHITESSNKVSSNKSIHSKTKIIVR